MMQLFLRKRKNVHTGRECVTAAGSHPAKTKIEMETTVLNCSKVKKYTFGFMVERRRRKDLDTAA